MYDKQYKLNLKKFILQCQPICGLNINKIKTQIFKLKKYKSSYIFCFAVKEKTLKPCKI